MQFKDMLKRQSDVAREAAEPAEKPDPGKSVVLAEKERAARDVIAAQLLSLGYVPIITADGNHALALVHDYQPRLVIANLELDGIGGRELFAALRSDTATRDIPVMLISNTAETPDMVAGGQVGANDYLCKPIDGATAKTRIRELLLRTSRETPEPPLALAAAPAERRPATPAAAAEPAKAADHIARAESLYAECCAFAKDAMDRAHRTEPPDVELCRGLATRLVQESERSNRLLLRGVRPYPLGESDHDAANVAIFSIKIGQGLNYDAEQLTALAMAALCHEVGMSCVPSEVATAQGAYSKKQWAELKRHPEHAFKILSKLGTEYAWLAEAVYQEHERERGQGYPRGLKGDDICEFAKITGLADTYESLSHQRFFRKAFIAFDALREIIGMRNKYFAPHIIRALVSEVSVFPLESYVLLNTAETARVVRTNPDNLLRPVVVVEYDAASQKLKRPKMIDLASKPLLYVTKPVDESELGKPK